MVICTNSLKSINTHELILFAGISLLLVGNFFFWRGFHNLDIAHNEEIIQYQINNKLLKEGKNMQFTLSEYQLDGDTHQLASVYLGGLKNIIKGLYISIISSFLVGYYLCEIKSGK